MPKTHPKKKPTPRNKQAKAVGRPKKWESAEVMQVAIDKYFDDKKASGDPVTVTGLAITLDLTRAGLINYAKEEEFFHTVKIAKMRVEEIVEGYLQNGNAGGAKFVLINNNEWAEKSETTLNTDNFTMTLDYKGKEG